MPDVKDITTSIGKHLGGATKFLGQGMEDHPLPTGAIVGASAAGLAAYKLSKYLKRKWDERSIEKPGTDKPAKEFYDTKEIDNW